MEDFDYELPSRSVAQAPVEPRDAARLLVGLSGANVEHRRVRDLPDLLEPGDLLVLNDTRVLPARLRLRKASGGAVEVFLLEESAGVWEALVRPSRKVPPGTLLLSEHGGEAVAEALDVLDDGRRLVRLLVDPAAVGTVPLPPYITRPLDDPERYQTVYARRPASSAAPTAGLHLTDDVLDRCRQRGIGVATVELVVGLDTFRPVVADRAEDHVMHSEAFVVPPETWDAVAATTGRVVAVGTTSVRALESAAATGALAGRTDLFIHGDYPFKVVDLLLTNFHMPRSSLLLLLDAFVGPGWRDLYEVALAEGYRFLSFGDAMLVARRP
jgi:S-adenosylmethionine:tRNA ribosyltransferase-isomerase